MSAARAPSAAPGPTPIAAAWSVEGTQVDEVFEALQRLHREHLDPKGGHAVAQTLNLLVAPCDTDAQVLVARAVAELGGHSASRTVVLREHEADRLDARAEIECEMPPEAGRVGLCFDLVVLTADRERLEHSASIVAPLLISELPSALWLPTPAQGVPDPALLDRVEHVVLDSDEGGLEALRNAATLGGTATVHDLAWARLDFWRAQTSAAFDPPERRSLLGRLDSLEVAYAGKALEAAHLYAGWVAARAGWELGALAPSNGKHEGEAVGGAGKVRVSLRRDHHARGCGGVEHAVFGAGSQRIKLPRGPAAQPHQDPFPLALRSAGWHERGYGPALEALAATLKSK